MAALITYRDNVAIVDIEVTAWFDDRFESLRENCKSTRIVVSNEEHEVVFDKSWNWLQTHQMLGFRQPGVYQVMLELKDGYGYINSITKMLEIKALQANFNLCVKDKTRWPLVTPVGSTLKETAELLANKHKEIVTAGMPNATLYRSTRELQAGSTLAIPAIDAPNFKIESYDAANPGNTPTSVNVVDLAEAQSDLLRLIDLKNISLVNSQSMTLPQYGATYLELQWDIELLANKFDVIFSQTKYSDKQSMHLEFVDASDLLAQIVEIVNADKHSLFELFTWSLQEVYDTEAAESAHWQLYACSKLPMSKAELWMSGESVEEPTMIVDYIWLTDNAAATCILTCDESLTSTTSNFEIEIAGDKQTFETTFGGQNQKDFVNLLNQLQAYFDAHAKTLQVTKAFVDDNDRTKKIALHATEPLTVNCDALIGKHLFDVPRYTRCDRWIAIEQGSIITVGSTLCCIPDEQTWAFEPYDLQWQAKFAGKVVAASNKWLFKHHVKNIGDYDIQLDIIDPVTKQTVQRLNKSVAVAKA